MPISSAADSSKNSMDISSKDFSRSNNIVADRELSPVMKVFIGVLCVSMLRLRQSSQLHF